MILKLVNTLLYMVLSWIYGIQARQERNRWYFAFSIVWLAMAMLQAACISMGR